MAGLLICPFENMEEVFMKCKDAFKRNPFLKPSLEIQEESVKIMKYMRITDEEDLNCYVDEEWAIFCVGTVIHENSALEDAIKKIANDLKEGSTVEEVCSKIDGTFLLTVLERKAKKLHVITDVASLLHSYYYKKDQLHVISTLQLSLVRSLPVTPSIKSMAQVMRSSYVLDEDTLFQEVKSLNYATIYSFDLKKGEVSKRKYHQLPTAINRSISFEEAAERLSGTLGRIIDLFPKDKTLVDFTGGNDSRSVMSYVYRDGKDKVDISALYTGPQESNEYKLMEETCLELGIRFYDFLPGEEFVNNFVEYMLNSHELSGGEENVALHAPILWSNLNKRKNGFSYSMHGSGGELFRDWRWDQEYGRRGAPRPANLERLIKWRVFQYEYDFSIFSKEFLPIVQQVPAQFLESYRKTVATIHPENGTNTLQLDTIYLLQNMRKWGGATISSTNQIISSVSPFLFREPLELALSMNPRFKMGNRLNKAIAERISPILAAKKMQNGSPYIVWKPERTLLFLPFYSFLMKKLLRKLSQVIFHKTVFSKITTHDFDPRPRFIKALESPLSLELLDFDRMQTRELFNRRGFLEFIERAKQPGFKYYKTLGNIITLELTMRESLLQKSIEFNRS